MARPAYKEIPYIDPVTAFQPFIGDPVSAFLDSADEGGGRGRYAYIAADPVDAITLSKGEIHQTDPFAKLRAMLRRAKLDTDPNLPPFQTGLCGMLGYELGGVIERLPDARGGNDFPCLSVGFYDTVVAFDTFERRAWVIGADVVAGRPSPARRIEALAERLQGGSPLPAIDSGPVATWRWEMDRADYEAAVQKAIDYIYAGDIFQANITTARSPSSRTGLIPICCTGD